MGWCMWSASRYNLQYTLLLLIPLLKQLEIIPHDYLQYTLLLLIHNEAVSTSLDDMNLQYTLLLLIPWIKAARRFLYFKFTIHFATINTIVAFNPASSFIPFTIHFATINTRTVKIIRQVINHLQYTLLLLILKIDGEYSYFNEKFTIHFATINTWIIRVTLQIWP